MTRKTKPTAGRLSLDMYVYGSEAIASALADYLEARALLGYPIRLSTLDEAIRDHAWKTSDNGLILTVDNIDLEPTSWSDSVIAIVGQRSSILGSLYPFVLRGNVLQKKSRTPRSDDYLRLLRICLAHSYGYVSKVKPESVLEEVVVQVLSSHGIPSHGVGTGSRKSKTFVRALDEAGRGVGLSPSKQPLPRRRYAKDAGVDVLSAITWGDPRPGQLTWLTQVTCGRSSTWEGKLKGPNPTVWMGYLLERVEPLRLLAVPHHVETDHLHELLDTRAGTVLDRLRMVGHLPPRVIGENEIENWFNTLLPEL